MHAQGFGQRGRAGHARAQGVDHHDAHQNWHAQLVHERQHQQQGHADQTQQIAAQHQALYWKALNQLARQGVTHGHACHQQAQIEAHFRFAGVQLVHEDERSCRNKGIDGGSGAAAANGKAQKLRRTQQSAVVIAHLAPVQLTGGTARFWQQAPHANGRQQAHDGQRGKDGAPAKKRIQPRAHGGGNTGADHHHQIEQRQAAHGGFWRGRVTRYGTAQRQTGAATQSLQQACANQHGRRGGQRRAKTGHGVEAQTGQQHGAAPQRIGHGVVNQLAHGQAHDIDGDGLLHLCAAGAEVLGSIRQGRNEHMHGQRTHNGDDGQQPQGGVGNRKLV